MTDTQHTEFDFILEYLHEKRGLNFSGNRPSMLERRINKRLSKTCNDSYLEYFKYLKHHDEELTDLLDVLTINVSSFFRDTLVFNYLGKKVIPSIIFKKINQKDQTIRIWSAGCASGEEPYSIAILLHEYLEKESLSFDVSIFATDIDYNSLEKAQQAKYSVESVQDISISRINSHFYKDNEMYQLSSLIREMVHFSHFDLLDTKHFSPPESIFGDFDMVLCRNVLIYFETPYQKIIYEKITKSLANGGYLALGESETLDNQFQSGFIKLTDCGQIYQKNRGE